MNKMKHLKLFYGVLGGLVGVVTVVITGRIIDDNFVLGLLTYPTLFLIPLLAIVGVCYGYIKSKVNDK